MNSNDRENMTKSRIQKTCQAGSALLLMFGAVIHSAIVLGADRDYYNPADKAHFQNVHSYHLQPGIERMVKGDWLGAYSHFDFILTGYANSPIALDKMSELCVTKWNVPRCVVDPWFDKAVERNPRISTTYVVYGIHLLRRGKTAEAIQKLNMAVELQPDSVNAHYNLGLAYFGVKQYELANRHAQASYALGAPFPGLREKLIKVRKWQPLPQAVSAKPGVQNDPSADGSPSAVPSQ